MLANTDADGAYVLAERIRKRIEANHISYEGHEIDFTVSLGVSELSTSFSEPTHWIDSADKGLYQAKRSGRNNTVIHTGCD